MFEYSYFEKLLALYKLKIPAYSIYKAVKYIGYIVGQCCCDGRYVK